MHLNAVPGLLLEPSIPGQIWFKQGTRAHGRCIAPNGMRQSICDGAHEEIVTF